MNARCDAMLVVRKAIFKWAEIRTGEQEEEEDGGRGRAEKFLRQNLFISWGDETGKKGRKEVKLWAAKVG